MTKKDVFKKYIGKWLHLESNEDISDGGFFYNKYFGKLMDSDLDFLEFEYLIQESGRKFSGPGYFGAIELAKEYENGKRNGLGTKREIINRGLVQKVKIVDL